MIKHKIKSKYGGLIEVNLTRNRAIKAMCTECCGWESDPKDCPSIECPVYPWRGKILLAYKKPLQSESKPETGVSEPTSTP